MKTTEEILEINKKQKEFYNTKKKNVVTKIWSNLRSGLLSKIRKSVGVHDQTYDLHKVWLGDLSTKKVLDLGCFSGNYLTEYLAKNSKEYVGIDLSDVAIAKLNKSLEPYENAKAIAADFLSETDFPDKEFDIIYAYGVLHHFENLDVLINKLNSKLKVGGRIISYDPLETSLPIKFIRVLYRPFQTDADWEWPFTRKTVKKFSTSFKVIERRGLLGKSKWFFLLNFLPMADQKRLELGKKWHRDDWEKSTTSDSVLFSCMHLTMLMEKK